MIWTISEGQLAQFPSPEGQKFSKLFLYQTNHYIREDILKLYIFKKSNIQFANMDWLKYTRKNLIELKKNLEKNQNSEIELEKIKNTTTYDLYINNKNQLEKWLKLPKKSIIKSTEQCRKICENYN